MTIGQDLATNLLWRFGKSGKHNNTLTVAAGFSFALAEKNSREQHRCDRLFC